VRTVYLGTSAFAAGILRALTPSPHRPVLVVTRPDRPRGGGRRLAAPPVAEAARELGLELDQPEDVNGSAARARIAAARPDLLVVCAFGALVREELLAAHEILNVHPSLLPRWRGAAPVERAIMAGDERTGVCIMRLTAGLDSGPVCLCAEEPIAPDDTYGTLAPRLERLGGELLLRALDERPPCHEQGEDGVTYAEKLTGEERTLDPGRPAAANERVVRALSPHVGARAQLPHTEGRFLGVWAARATGRDDAPPTLHEHDGRLFLAALELLEVQPPGGRRMSAAEYLRGRPPRTPSSTG
jgi:methionyl-tRNA formyltransferase